MLPLKRPLMVLLGGFVLLTAFALSAPLLSTAQPTSYPSAEPNKELDEKIRLFFDEIMNSNSTKAFEDLLRSGSTGSVSGSPSAAEMKAKLDEIKKQFGEFQGFEKIDEKSIVKSNDLVIIRYLMKCDYHPVVWTFTFYRRPLHGGSTSSIPTSWQVVGLRFDTNLDLLSL